MQTLVETNDGFKIAEVDMELRGPGDMEGTQQSGMLRFMIANLAQDGLILAAARDTAVEILEQDPDLSTPENQRLKVHLASEGREAKVWSRIS